MVQEKDKTIKKLEDSRAKDIAALKVEKKASEDALSCSTRENTRLKDKENTLMEIFKSMKKFMDINSSENDNGESNVSLSCDECSETFKDIENLNKHKRNLHGPVNVNCTLCAYVANSAADLRTHMNSHHEFQCEQCNFRDNKEENVLNHEIAVHSKFDCDMCAFVARTEEVLETHKSECHFILDSEIKLQDHKSKKHEANKYHCDYCGFAASTLAQLDLHIGSYHNITKRPAKINKERSGRSYSLDKNQKNGACRNFNDGSCRIPQLM